MAFGWFSKGGGGADRRLQKADKLAAQQRWAEALTFYQEALEGQPDSTPAREGRDRCRQQLVAWNLDECQAFVTAQEPARALEHAQLALELAGDDTTLAKRAQEVLAKVAAPKAPAREAEPVRLGHSSCGRMTPCGDDGAGVEPEGESHPEDLFEFYLEGLSEPEMAAFTPLGDDFRRGFVLLQQGEIAAAKPALEAAVRAAPEAVGAHFALGLLATLEGNTDAAESALGRALELDPEFGPAVLHRAQNLRHEGRSEAAATLLGDWLATHDSDPEGWLQLASVRADQGDHEGAAAAAARADALLPPTDPRPGLLRAVALRNLGRTDDAIEAIQPVVARRPDFLDALAILGDLLLRKGSGTAERAAEVYRQCYRLDPQRGWWYLLRIAQAYHARGWTAGAQDMLAEAEQELPEEDEARAQWTAVRDALGAAAP